MGKKEPTQDEKLLDAVKEKDLEEIGPKTKKRRLVFPPAIKIYYNRFILLFKNIKPRKKRTTGLKIDFRWANFVLMLISSILVFYLIYDYLIKASLPLGGINKSELIVSLRSGKDVINLKEKGFYAEIVRKNIFSPKKEEPPVNNAMEEEPLIILIDPLVEIEKNLKLVGIIWGENPQVLIENKREARTYLLSRGDLIGLAVVKNIYTDKVVLVYDGLEFELE